MAGQKVCLDTTFLVDLLRGMRQAVERAGQLKKEKYELYTTSISAFELYIGAYKSRKPKRVVDVEEVLSDLILLSIGKGEAEESSKIFVELMEKGEIIDMRDALIAGCMLKNDCHTIITKNIAHFTRISGIVTLTY